MRRRAAHRVLRPRDFPPCPPRALLPLLPHLRQLQGVLCPQLPQQPRPLSRLLPLLLVQLLLRPRQRSLPLPYPSPQLVRLPREVGELRGFTLQP